MPPGAGPEWVETEVIEVCRPDRPEEPHLRPHVVVLRERPGWPTWPPRSASAGPTSGPPGSGAAGVADRS
jgi:hypothetical protein